MSPLEEAPTIVGHGVNVQGIATLGIAAIAVYVGYRIFRNLSKS